MKTNIGNANVEFALVKKIAHAIIHFDSKEKTYTISLIDKGGPIIKENTLDIAKSKFQAALNLSNAVRNFLYYQGATNSQTTKNRRFYTDRMKERFDHIEYHEMVA